MSKAAVFLSKLRNVQDLQDRIQWLNSSEETVPPFGVVKLFSHDAVLNQYQIDKPDGSAGLYYVNGPAATLVNDYSGSGMWNLPRRCLLDADTYNVGDEVGPVADQWYMSGEGNGWRVLRPPDADNRAVVQIIGGGSSAILPGVVSESLGKGYYTIELAEWAGVTPVDVEDICDQATGSLSTSGDDSCEDIILPDFEPQHTGIGVYVLAYDPRSVLVPLEIGSDCYLANLGSENSSGSGSGESSPTDTEPVFAILNGYQTHTVAYDKEYMCCNDGSWKLISKRAYIFAAKVCEPAECDVCPEVAP